MRMKKTYFQVLSTKGKFFVIWKSKRKRAHQSIISMEDIEAILPGKDSHYFKHKSNVSGKAIEIIFRTARALKHSHQP